MQNRGVRLGLVALLLVVGAAAAFVAWDGERRIRLLDEERQARDAGVERLLPALAGIAAAQQAYADYGSRDEPTFARTSMLIDGMATDAAALLASPAEQDSTHLEDFWAALSALRAADAEAQQRLAAGEPLAAADALLAGARPHVTAADTSLRAWQRAAAERSASVRAGLIQRSWIALGGAAGVWLLGLVALARLPPRNDTWFDFTKIEKSNQVSFPVEPAPSVGHEPSIDLAATAGVCAELARMTDSAALPAILARAATILHAHGIIVWMGAGDDLYPAASHGYERPVLARLRPIRRTDENATAAAWRQCRLRTVDPVDGSPGAIVAPIAGADGCIGVLAAEVAPGREVDAATQAVAAILGAQLATVLTAWPAASGASTDTGNTAGSDRQTAAS